jgi:hypothetical protein
MKSAIPVTVFALAVMVVLPESAPAKSVIVCSGSDLNCYYAPAGIKIPGACTKSADTYGGRLVFRCSARTTAAAAQPPDLGLAQGQLRPAPPVRHRR